MAAETAHWPRCCRIRPPLPPASRCAAKTLPDDGVDFMQILSAVCFRLPRKSLSLHEMRKKRCQFFQQGSRAFWARRRRLPSALPAQPPTSRRCAAVHRSFHLLHLTVSKRAAQWVSRVRGDDKDQMPAAFGPSFPAVHSGSTPSIRIMHRGTSL